MAKMKRQRKFTCETDEKLIEAVRVYTELYDLSHKRYGDNAHRASVWRNIGHKIKQDPRSCRQRWESLRSQYRKVRRLRKIKYGPGAVNIPKWKYEDELRFLHPFMKGKQRIPSFVQGTGDNDNDDASMLEENVAQSLLSSSASTHSKQGTPLSEPSTSDSVPIQVLTTPQAKTKRTSQAATEMPTAGSTTPMNFLSEEEKRKQNENKDEIDSFFETMKRTVKKFSAADRHTAKHQIFSIVSMLEGKYVDPQQVQSHHHQIQSFQAHERSTFLQQSMPSHLPPIGNHNLACTGLNSVPCTPNQYHVLPSNHFSQSSNSSHESTSLPPEHSRPNSTAFVDFQDFSPDIEIAKIKFE